LYIIKITSIKNIGKRERGKGKEEENVDGSIVCDLNERGWRAQFL